jgi:UTP pyrophosphatase
VKYLNGYPEAVLAQVRSAMDQGRLGELLQHKYRGVHEVRTDRALYDYVMGLKNEYLRGAEPLAKVAYDSKLHVVRNALGTHTAVSRVQGGKLKAKREIRVATLFREVPGEFLRMIVVHELAHMKEKEHGKAFYQLCAHMEPNYHQYEFDVRLYLTHVEAGGKLDWG